MRPVALIVLFLCGIVPAAWAQSSTHGALVGGVADASRAVLPGAGVVALNLDTGIERRTTTDQRGEFRLEFLPPGRYRVEATLSGFATSAVPEVVVHVSETARVNLRLSVAGVSEDVVVSAAAINTQTAAIGQIITESNIRNMPLNGREFIELSGLVPGVETGNTKRGSRESKGFSASFNGARSGYTAYYVDGADSTDANYNQLISSPALDAIKEFRVETSLYSARYGRAGGGLVNVVTKSGTNRFSGSLYEYHRNKAFDARPYFYTGTKEDQPEYKFNQYGGSIGGPIARNKTFFFVATEFFRQVKPGQLMESFAPTAKERAGDFTDSINPLTNQPVVLRNPFTGQVIESGIIPEELMNPVGRTLMDLWPAPNFDDPILNLRLLRSGQNHQNKLLTKIDHNFSSRTALSGSFNYSKYDNTTPGHTVYSDVNNVQHDRTFVASLTHTFRNNLVNDLKVNYTSYRNGTEFVKNDKNYAKEWGFWAGHEKPEATGPPRILFYTAGFRVFQIGSSGPNVRANRNIYVRDDLVWTKNNHMFSFGGDFKQQNFDWTISNPTPFGAYYFGILDGNPSLDFIYGVTGSTFASALMGVTARTTYDTFDGIPAKLRRNMFSAYVQDDWRVSPRLTLNLGLRYDYEQPFTALDNQFLTLNHETAMPRYSAGAPEHKLALLKFPYETGGPNRAYDDNRLNFAPRLSFAWRPFADNATAVRGGYGMVYTSENAYTTTYGVFVVPFSGQYEYFSRARFWPDGQDHFVPVDQEPYQVTYPAGTSPGTFQPTTPYYPAGYMEHWNLSFARELGWQTSAEVAYVGSRGVNLNGVTSLAAYDPELNARVRENVPNWTIALRTKGYNSNYHSFQAKANKRLSNGLNFLAAYTWAHARAEASNDDVNENSLFEMDELGQQIQQNRWSDADFDIRHRFSLSARYELPIGRNRAIGRNWGPVADSLLGGWSANVIWLLQSGRPYSVREADGSVPDRICDGALPANERTPEQWFDYACFPSHSARTIIGADGITRSVDTQGNAGTNIIRGPGWNNVDLGLHKEIHLPGSSLVQLRIEAFNLFNRPNFIGPSSNFFMNNASGARITTIRDSRSIQLAAKFLF